MTDIASVDTGRKEAKILNLLPDRSVSPPPVLVGRYRLHEQ